MKVYLYDKMTKLRTTKYLYHPSHVWVCVDRSPQTRRSYFTWSEWLHHLFNPTCFQGLLYFHLDLLQLLLLDVSVLKGGRRCREAVVMTLITRCE